MRKARQAKARLGKKEKKENFSDEGEFAEVPVVSGKTVLVGGSLEEVGVSRTKLR